MGVLGATPALAAETFGEDRFYLGDLHVHTGASLDGGSSDIEGSCDLDAGDCLAVADIHETARAAGLDFWAVTDHVNGGNAAEAGVFEEVLDTVLAGSDAEAEYVTIPGAEVWFDFTHRRLGHKTLLLMGKDEEVADVTLQGLQFAAEETFIGSCDDIWRYAERLESDYGNVLLIAHHPGLDKTMNTAWECHAGQRAAWYSPSVEIYSNHGNSEHAHTEYDPLWGGVVDSGTVEHAISPDGEGLQLGFIGGTDSHDTRPGSVCTRDTQHVNHPYGGGLTVVALREGERFDRGAIFEAIQDRRTYATSGPLVPLQVRYAQHGVELGTMGDDLRLDPTAALDIEVSVPEEWLRLIQQVDLVTPGDFDGEDLLFFDDEAGAWTGSLDARDFDTFLYPRVVLDGVGYYGEGGCSDGGEGSEEMLWVSPSYITLASVGTPEEEPYPEEMAMASGRSTVGDDASRWSNGRSADRPVERPVRPVSCSGVGTAALWLGPLALALLGLRRRED